MTATAPPSSPHPALIGRDGEIVFLRKRLGEATLGSGSFTVITAEAGVGKTRLLEEIADVAAARGIPVLRGGGQSAAARVPFDLFSGVLAALASGTGRPAVRDLVAETMPQLWSRVFAEARPAVEAAGAPELRQRLFLSRLVQLLIERAGDGALLLCLEDLHETDTASLQLLAHLALHVNDAGVMVAASTRPPAGPEADGLQRLLHDIHRHEHVHRLQLAPLPAAESRALIRACFPREGFTDEFIGLAIRRSGGVPQHLLATLEFLRARGIVHEEHGLWLNRKFDEDDVPVSVRDAVRKRLETIDEGERDLLGMAAVQGASFRGTLLAQTLAQSVTRTLRQLGDIARRTRLIKPEPGGFRFSHPVLAEMLYLRLAEPQRRHVHVRLAHLLEHDRPDDREAIAHHLYEAGLHGRALQPLLDSARRAIDAFAYREARVLLSKARHSCDALGAAAPAALALEALVLQSEVEDRLGDRPRALAAARQVLGRAAGDEVLTGRALLQIAQVQRRQGQWDDAEASYRQALERFLQAGDEARAAKTQIGMGNLAFERSDIDAAQACFGDARDVALRLGDHALLGAIYGNLGVIATVRGESMQAVLHYTEAIKSYSRVHHQYGICQTHHNLGMCYANQGEWSEALVTYTRGEELAEQLGTLDVLANLRVSKALALARTGDLDAAEGSCLQATKLMERLGDRLGVAECRKVEGMILAGRGQLDEARQKLEQGRHVCQELDNQLGAAECDVELALLAHRGGDPQTARSRLESAARVFEQLGAATELQRASELLAEWAA